MAELSDQLASDVFLKTYYSRIFPYNKYFDWLNYAHEGFNKTGRLGMLPYREFSFTVKGDVYIRYLTFETKDELRNKMQELKPIKIDIGAEYNDRPEKLRSRVIEAQRRELVFDVDLTDYDSVRKCCQGGKMCPKCWKFMVIAVKIINTTLDEDFDFHHTLWVYSGRRGIHCWVCDKEARKLNSRTRKGLVDYISLNPCYNKSRPYLYRRHNIHPNVMRACSIIDEYFVNLCVIDQDMLGTQESIDKFMTHIPDERFKTQLRSKFAESTTSLERWNAFLAQYDTFSQKGLLKFNMRQIREYIKMLYAYPRLDANVTSGMKHLLKSPFCIHPKTGQVCVPFSPKSVDTFDPFQVPTLELLLEELQTFDLKRQNMNVLLDDDQTPSTTKEVKVDQDDGRKTSLIKALHVFDRFLSRLKRFGGEPPSVSES